MKSETAKYIRRMRDGNLRFINGKSLAGRGEDGYRPFTPACCQRPFAAVLGCADSRVPPEIVFDQGPGDLFVVRVAGNIVTPAVSESLKFAVRELGVRLLLVLGHSGCGAVRYAIGRVLNEEPVNAAYSVIEQHIAPVVKNAILTEGDDAGECEIECSSVRANIFNAVHRLCNDDDCGLAEYVRSRGLEITGAEYSLETGRVDFCDT